MMRPLAFAFQTFDRGLLEGASLLVPTTLRWEWRREWQAEMWHVRQACAKEREASWRAEREVMAFCLGAFPDAWCLSREARRDSAPPAPRHSSAFQCLLCLTVALAISYAFALLLPEVRTARNPLRYSLRSGVILLEGLGPDEGPDPNVSFKQFRVWGTARHRYFDGFAFYKLHRQSVVAGAEAPSRWNIAESSANLFALLGVPIRFARGEDGIADAPRAILSYSVWKDEFGGDPAIVGSLISVGGRETRIAGVAPERAWKLPGRPDAWLLEPDNQIPASTKGNVIAHLTGEGRAKMWADRVDVTVYNADHSEQDFLGIAFNERTPGPREIYRFAVLLALLALPAITSVSLGEFSVSSHRPPWPKRILRWTYLAAKLALLLPIANFVSLDVAYWHPSQHSSASEYVQLLVTFLICLFGIRWALLDQRQRCPICLKRVAHPAQVGLASRTFLAWNGTELICTGGHTLLHVPGLPTSWFGTQRWLYLDASWDFLFARPEAS